MKTSNVAIVDLSDGRQVCLSYGVAVAAFIPRGSTQHFSSCDACGYRGPCTTCPTCVQPTVAGSNDCGYIKTDRKWSVTSSKHANAFCGQGATIVPDSVFVQLIAPIEAKGRD